MTIPATNIKFSDLQTEFGGSNPISLSEYYRDSTKTTASLQDSSTNMSGTTNVHSSTSNANIPVIPIAPATTPIKLSQFNGAREYAINNYSYAGTGGLIYFVSANGFSSVGSGSWATRYRLDNVANFTVPYRGRLRVDSVYMAVQGYYDSGGVYDDTDFSEVGYPGYRIRDGSGNEIVNVIGGISQTSSNDPVSVTTSVAIVNLPNEAVGVTYYLDIFCEGYTGVSANPPYVQFGEIYISIAVD